MEEYTPDMDQMLFDDLFDDANQICTDQWKCSKRRSQYFRQAREEVRQACIKEMVGWPQCLSTCARKFQDIYNDLRREANIGKLTQIVEVESA